MWSKIAFARSGPRPTQERYPMKFIVFFILTASEVMAQSQPTSGRWDGTIVLRDLKVPFSMQLDFTQNNVSGAFVNGEEKVSSTQGTLGGGVLRLTFQQYDTMLEANVGLGGLNGEYGGARFGKYGVQAGPYCTCAVAGEAGPDISGTWLVGETGVASSTPSRLVIQRKGSDTNVHFLRPEDANGELTGLFDGLSFLLHHFDGARASLMELEPRPDGTLDVTLREPGAVVKKFHAVRMTDRQGEKAEIRGRIN